VSNEIAPKHSFIWGDSWPLRGLAPATDDAGGHTLPFENWQSMRFLKWYMVCPPASSEAGARPLEGQQSIQINECLGAISVFIYGEIMENARGNHGEIMGNPWGMPLGRRFHRENHGEYMGNTWGNAWGMHGECMGNPGNAFGTTMFSSKILMNTLRNWNGHLKKFDRHLQDAGNAQICAGLLSFGLPLHSLEVDVVHFWKFYYTICTFLKNFEKNNFQKCSKFFRKRQRPDVPII
jgi:hypothetical protein